MNDLYFLMGAALCHIQLLEAALSCSITLKKDVKYPGAKSRSEGDSILKEYQARTLGQAIKRAKKASIYGEDIERKLDSILLERNWLVHKCLTEYFDEIRDEPGRREFFKRIKEIAIQSKSLKKEIEIDLAEFSEFHGMDMTAIREVISKYS